MKKVFTFLAAVLCAVAFVNAQTYEWYVDDATITSVPADNNVISVTGTTNLNTKYTGTYNGIECNRALKFESGTVIAITNAKTATITIVQSLTTNGEKNFKFDNVEQTNSEEVDGVKVFTIKDVEAGTHSVGRISEIGIIYIGVVYDETSGDTRVEAPISWEPGSISLSWGERESFITPQLVNEKNLDVVISADGEVVGYDESTQTFSILKAGNGYIKATYTSTSESDYLDNVAMCNVQVAKDVTCVDYPVGNVAPEVMLTMPEAGDVAAGFTFGDDNVINAYTPFATTGKTDKAPTMFGSSFSGYMQVRVAAVPNADNLTGTENSGSSSVVLAPTKNMTLYVYGRQQSVNQTKDDPNYDTWGFTSNDGKSIKIVAHGAPSDNIPSTQIFSHWESEDYQYGYLVTVFQLEAGETYTMFASGTTYGVFAIGYTPEKEALPSIEAPAHDRNGDIVEADGEQVITFTPAVEGHVIYTCFVPAVVDNAMALAADATIEHEGKIFTLAADNQVTVSTSGTLHYFAMDPETGIKSDVNTIEFAISTAINDINVDNVNAPVEYFNLQGIRVENPSKGLYIRRQGNKVEKVYVK